MNDYQKQQLEKAVKNNIWASDIWDGASYETNDFGDNWTRGPAQAKTEKELDREFDQAQRRRNINFWVMMSFLVIVPALFWVYVLIALVCRAAGYNIVE